jgi:eukaryotic-like serine/threonine-protein kinase
MPDRAAFFLEGILQLERYDPKDRRGIFRQSIAELALAPPGQAPLEGRDPRAIGQSVKVALADGLFDDLAWLAASAASVSLYEIARALPQGAERRELQRRVGVQLHEGNAATFVSLATRMAIGSERGLAVSTVRARVALALSLPGTVDVPVDPLAFALISQRDLASEWLGARSVGSLPERRLAARLLERAAREAAGRRRQGDDDPIRLFRRALRGRADPSMSRRVDAFELDAAWRLLMSDRETLVWRHVAVARGLLAAALPELQEEIMAALSAGLSPTEWRRGATSLVASIAVDPERALPAALELLKGPLLERDPGIATAMLWGVPRAADIEPEAAGELLDAISLAAPLFVAETLVDLRAELGSIRGRAASRCAAALADTLGRVGEEDVLALGHVILSDLRSDLAELGGEREAREAVKLGVEIRLALEKAVEAFIETGTREAHAHAQTAAERAEEAMTALEGIAVDRTGVPSSGLGRAVATILVRELDMQLLESGVLRSLLFLNRRPSDNSPGGGIVDELEERLAGFLIRTAKAPVSAEEIPRYVTLHQRRLRALLHLIDGDTSELEEDLERRARLRDRWRSACRLLLARLSQEISPPIRRALVATVARALDALLRDGAVDPADVLLYAAARATVPGDMSVLCEASMQPDTSRLLRAYARFLDEASSGSGGARLAALDAMIAEIPPSATSRLESLRNALSRLARSLGVVEAAVLLRPLADPDASPLATLEEALFRITQLTRDAIQSCGAEDGADPEALPTAPYPLFMAAGRAVQPGADAAAELGPSVEAVIARARSLIPPAIADLCAGVLPRIVELPVDPESLSGSRAAARRIDEARALDARLPSWLPSRRTLGGFYVQRQIGGGAAGTVFVVTRVEERHDPEAERFALKVPEYDATAARSLSEADFLKLFREEAGALLAIPEHPNLARFVTFDVGARPKPILVMELIEGTRCDQLIASRLLTVPRALRILDGVLVGLSAMHAVGVGHLDIKPTNVILRATGEPVLVDFGLAGRHIRPGCATSSYGAPEVWGIAPEGVTPTPLTADVYSFGCFAYEVLTGETLFDAPHEIALISAHLTHDGMPPAVKRLSESAGTAALSRLLYRCLRRSPVDRGTVTDVRAELRELADGLGKERWPVVS